jgi:hypothetical protein
VPARSCPAFQNSVHPVKSGVSKLPKLNVLHISTLRKKEKKKKKKKKRKVDGYTITSTR